jgi:cobaltochelatase CobT
MSRELWLSDGKPSKPGRLNDLRHLIYKPFAADIGTSAPNFGIMMREGLLKENIDGEAVLWATSRLLAQNAEKRFLVVFSDGAPVDDSTLSVNPGNFLHVHLNAVINAVIPHVNLSAIGIGHNVEEYYPNAITVADLNHMPLSFFRNMTRDRTFLECVRN